MLMTLPKFDYFSCKTMEEAFSFLSSHKQDARVLAGGTDLLIKMKHKRTMPKHLVDIKRIPDLDYIRHDEERGLQIGALTSVQSIRNSPLIGKRFPALHDCASVLGTRQIRNLATLGGNLCNASPAAECAPALLAYDARVKIQGPQSERTIPLEKFFLGPGVSAMKEDEILTGIEVPSVPIETKGVYLKHSTRRIDVAIVGVGVVIRMDGQVCSDIRIALGAVGPTPFRARKAEDVIRGEKVTEAVLERTAQTASEESFPIDDIRGYADYRIEMVRTQVREGIERAISGKRL